MCYVTCQILLQEFTYSACGKQLPEQSHTMPSASGQATDVAAVLGILPWIGDDVSCAEGT